MTGAAAVVVIGGSRIRAIVTRSTPQEGVASPDRTGGRDLVRSYQPKRTPPVLPIPLDAELRKTRAHSGSTHSPT